MTNDAAGTRSDHDGRNPSDVGAEVDADADADAVHRGMSAVRPGGPETAPRDGDPLVLLPAMAGG